MEKRNLFIIHRAAQYDRDFDEIAAKVKALDPGIAVQHLPVASQLELPESVWQHPTLTVALSGKFRFPVRRGPILRNRLIGKFAQQ